jgi:hypothetical protein
MINNNDGRIQDLTLLLKIPYGRRKVLCENDRLWAPTSGSFASPALGFRAVCIKGTSPDDSSSKTGPNIHTRGVSVSVIYQ